MTHTYQERKLYQASANDLFSYCVDAIRVIGAEIESSDRELGIVHANYYLQMGSVYSGNIGIYVTLMPRGERMSEAAVETYGLYADASRFRPVHKLQEVAQQIFFRVGDAVALAEATKRASNGV